MRLTIPAIVGSTLATLALACDGLVGLSPPSPATDAPDGARDYGSSVSGTIDGYGFEQASATAVLGEPSEELQLRLKNVEQTCGTGLIVASSVGMEIYVGSTYQPGTYYVPESVDGGDQAAGFFHVWNDEGQDLPGAFFATPGGSLVVEKVSPTVTGHFDFTFDLVGPDGGLQLTRRGTRDGHLRRGDLPGRIGRRR